MIKYSEKEKKWLDKSIPLTLLLCIVFFSPDISSSKSTALAPRIRFCCYFSFAFFKFNYLRLFQRFSFYVFAKALKRHKTIGCCFTCFCCCDTFSTAIYALTQCFCIHTLAAQLMQNSICLAAFYSSRRTRTRTKFNGMIFVFLSANSIARNEIRCVHSCSAWSISFRWVEGS